MIRSWHSGGFDYKSQRMKNVEEIEAARVVSAEISSGAEQLKRKLKIRELRLSSNSPPPPSPPLQSFSPPPILIVLITLPDRGLKTDISEQTTRREPVLLILIHIK